MKRIKVTRGGCGIKYTDAKGNVRHELKTAQSGPFECDDMQAARLVELGVAVYCDELGWREISPDIVPEDVVAPVDNQDDQPKTDTEPEKVTGHLDAEDLAKWDYNDLKALAADMGVKPASMKKADLIAAIVAEEVELGPEMEPENEEDELDELDPENDLPELGAADPE